MVGWCFQHLFHLSTTTSLSRVSFGFSSLSLYSLPRGPRMFWALNSCIEPRFCCGNEGLNLLVSSECWGMTVLWNSRLCSSRFWFLPFFPSHVFVQFIISGSIDSNRSFGNELEREWSLSTKGIHLTPHEFIDRGDSSSWVEKAVFFTRFLIPFIWLIFLWISFGNMFFMLLGSYG